MFSENVNRDAFPERIISNDTIDIVVFIKDITHEEVIQEFEERYPEEKNIYCTVKDSENAIVINDEEALLLDSAIAHKREIYREHYNNWNSTFVSKYTGIAEVVFLSEYSPLVVLRGPSDVISQLAEDEMVEMVQELPQIVPVNESLAVANALSRADYVRDTCGNRGAGVKIGMIEAEGIPDLSDAYLSQSSIVLKDSTDPISVHATKVARILVGKSTNTADKGFAPDATLYCCYTPSLTTILSGIEWLVSMQVNVINASMGIEQLGGIYEFLDKWVDHLAVQHDMHFVVAAGNISEADPSFFVRTPGLAYNAITVGAFNPYTSIWSQVGQFAIAYYSCYLEDGISRPEKPNLVADGTGFWGADGTSFAAPQVTGTIAQLCSYNSALKTKQTSVGAILMAAAAHKVDAVGAGKVGDIFEQAVLVDGEPQISNKEGAGVLDSRWARDIAVNGKYWSATVYDAGFPYNKSVYINATTDKVVRVCIFWLRQNSVSLPHASSNVTVGTFSNLDLYILDPSGYQIDSSTAIRGNFEIVQFSPSVSGTYTIQIQDLGGHTGKDYIGIALWEGNYGN